MVHDYYLSFFISVVASLGLHNRPVVVVVVVIIIIDRVVVVAS